MTASLMGVRQDYNVAAIEAIAKAPVSPLKKIKRKVGYGDSTEEDSDKSDRPARTAMKRLCLEDGPTGSHVDDSMSV